MAREKNGYREMLEFLAKDHPLTMTQKEAAECIGVSAPHMRKLVVMGKIKVVCGKVPIGSVANFLCG